MGYYNEGSSFYCRFCRRSFHVSTQMADECMRLDDTITLTTDGYDNFTPPGQ